MASKKRFCAKCLAPIPPARVKALPGTTTCVGCSTVPKRIGFMVFDHKTAPALVQIDPEDAEQVRVAKRFNRRAR